MSNKKIKIITISDHPFAPSGIGHMTKNMIEHLLKGYPDKYEFFSLGGAMRHENYDLSIVPEYGENWKILPVDNYGNQDIIRSIVRNENPDILWFMTDPRFWGWLWAIEHEIRPLCPMIYYHVWDNYPLPTYNRSAYLSNDQIVTISKVTDDIVKQVAPEVERTYLPHAVNTDVFKPLKDDEVSVLRSENMPDVASDKVIFFWNNRNARRKQSGTLIHWFKKFLDKVGHDKACLIMHTNSNDPHGQPLDQILHELKITEGQIFLSQDKYPPENLAALYNMADCTINISDAEGFGLSTLESLACGTPIVVNMTGGLQEQVTDGKEWFGIGIEPCSKAIIGSQEIPWIYEDRLNEDEFIDALTKIYEMSPEERRELGLKGHQHVLKNYSFNKYIEQWDTVFTESYENFGSWSTRKKYKPWEMIKL